MLARYSHAVGVPLTKAWASEPRFSKKRGSPLTEFQSDTTVISLIFCLQNQHMLSRTKLVKIVPVIKMLINILHMLPGAPLMLYYDCYHSSENN